MTRALKPAGLLVGIAVLCVLPFLVSDFRARELALVGMFFIAILGLDLLTGYGGQISLGHGAFMAVGGYTTAILMAHHGWRDIATIPAAFVVTGLVGLAFGLPALRLAGLYLALATFGIAVAFPSILKKFGHFTGGSTGLSIFGGLTGHGFAVTILGHEITNGYWLYGLTWTIGIALLLLAWALLASRFGRSLRAVRDSELAAASSGINRSIYKVGAFGISAAFAGVAGSLYAIAAAFVSPDTYSIQLSLFLLVGAVVGAFGSIWGAFAGALLIQFLPDVVDALPRVDTTQPGRATFFFGAILVALMLVLPLLTRLTTRLYSRSHSTA